MATTTATYPVSLRQPSWYGIDFSRRSSGLRPFSFALPKEPRSHRQSSSVSDAHHSATMGFNLGDKVPTQIRRSSRSRPRTPLPEVTNTDPHVPVDDQGSPKRTNRFLSSSLQRAKKRRSISSFFSSNGDLPSVSMAIDIVSTPMVAMINDRPASTPPVVPKRVSVIPEADMEMQDEERADRFRQKNHFLMKHGMKHHPYPQEAPYMQAYDPVLLDNDRFTDILLRRLNSNGSPTFHDYGLNPPLNVLDLGCGQGRWVVEAATAWKSFGTKVTGYDLMDVWGQSSEVNRGSLDNISWVQGNFLNSQLPFADNSFDLVRMANLSLAIPEDSWVPLLSEVRRILAPEGRLELIDDQILFPYDDSPPQIPLPTPRRSPQSTSPFDTDSDHDMIDAGITSTLADMSTDLKHPSQTFQERRSPQLSEADWEAHAANSKGLETIFESMLLKKYDIHPRPQDIIDIVLSRVFGHKHADRIKSMHLALAPADQAERDRMADSMTMVGPEADGTIQLINGRSDDLSDADDREEAEELERPKQPARSMGFKSDTISPKAAELLSISSSGLSNTDSNRTVQLTESLGARAVGRFTLHPTKKWKGKWSESARGRRASMENLHSDIPGSISPKAAERLGIAPVDRRSWGSQHSQGSQSCEAKCMDRSSSERMGRDGTILDTNGAKTANCSSINPSLGVAQSPGFILWPSTFIPVEPLELEMHACKHMHVLLGCKAALSNFIQDVKGPDGQAHISQDELNDLTWEYECFRRKRFNWPAELPNSRLSFTSFAATPKFFSDRSDASFERPATSSATDSTFFLQPSGSVRPKKSHNYQTNTCYESARPTYNREDLTFVRVIRVYEAYNIGKL